MEFLLLMHDDSKSLETGSWDDYISGLISRGVFAGGSSLSGRKVLRLSGEPACPSGLVGFIRLKCRDLDHALKQVDGNPAYLAGATVELSQLVEDA